MEGIWHHHGAWACHPGPSHPRQHPLRRSVDYIRCRRGGYDQQSVAAAGRHLGEDSRDAGAVYIGYVALLRSKGQERGVRLLQTIPRDGGSRCVEQHAALLTGLPHVEIPAARSRKQIKL